MATTGAPAPRRIAAEGLTVAVVVTEWNAEIVDKLRDRALEAAREAGAKAELFTVAGALELPVVAQACARRFDAVVALGCVIRGETAHFDYVCDSVTEGLTRVTSSYPRGRGGDNIHHQWSFVRGANARTRARVSAVDKAASMASAPLSSFAPGPPVRARAWSRFSTVSTPLPTGTCSSSATRVRPSVTESQT